MSSPSPSFDDLLFDALTLRPFQRISSAVIPRPEAQGAGEARPFLTTDAEVTEVPQDEVRPLTPGEARQRLDDLMARPAQREQLMLELDRLELDGLEPGQLEPGQVGPDGAIFRHLAALLGATNADEFTQALMAWTGTAQPEALERHLQTLTHNMEDALAHLRNGPPSPLKTTGIQPDTARIGAETTPPISPLLLGFLALSQVAQANELERDAPQAFPAAPPAVSLPKVQLDFSSTNLNKVLGRNSSSDS